jgi:dipeptidyl aminopeptidase/acylaminoacyl peptidase
MWNPELKEESELYKVSVAGGQPVKVSDEERRALPPAHAEMNADRSQLVYAKGDDVVLYDLRSQKGRTVLHSYDGASSPHFSFDQKKITFERNQNLFAWDIATGELRQLTRFTPGKNPEEKPTPTKMQDYLEKQQLELFDVLKKREKEEKERKEKDKKDRGPEPEPYYLGEDTTISDLRLSRDGSVVLFEQTDNKPTKESRITEMPQYVTKSGYTEMEKLNGRVKAGESESRRKLGIYSTETGKVVWVDARQGDRPLNFSSTYWSWDGNRVFALAESDDYKDMWVLNVDLKSGQTRFIDHEHDDAWIYWTRDFGWLRDNQTVWFSSERDGFRHLYEVSADGGEPKQLTQGKFEIFSPRLSPDGSRLYFMTNEVSPAERQLYSMPATGGTIARLTHKRGCYNDDAGFGGELAMSPDGHQIALTYSNGNTPGEIYLVSAEAASAADSEKRMTDSMTAEFKSYPWPRPEVVHFPDVDGLPMYALLWKPQNPNPLHPAVIWVHGAGPVQEVLDEWSPHGWWDRTPFHDFLVAQGYTVLSIDYRGSAGYGRNWRNETHNDLGNKDILSSVAAADYLVKEQHIDRHRIGIYGGSYGGFYTLMALFKHPGVFAAGASLFPVTDWAHYNNGYTQYMLGLPWTDDAGYRSSSPIYFANGLQDRLLILHGVSDSNVHFQDTVRLTQRLMELKKTNWDVAMYPVESHGWENETSDLDSARRILALFDETLKKK